MQPDQPTKFQQVIQTLQKEGYSDEQIASLTTELTKASYAQLYTECMSQFKEEDFQDIEKCKNQEEADVMIRRIYIMRTGKNPDEDMKVFLEQFSQGFLEEYQKDKATS